MTLAKNLRSVSLATGLVMAALAGPAPAQQPYPSHAITLVVPFAAGGLDPRRHKGLGDLLEEVLVRIHRRVHFLKLSVTGD